MRGLRNIAIVVLLAGTIQAPALGQEEPATGASAGRGTASMNRKYASDEQAVRDFAIAHERGDEKTMDHIVNRSSVGPFMMANVLLRHHAKKKLGRSPGERKDFPTLAREFCKRIDDVTDRKAIEKLVESWDRLTLDDLQRELDIRATGARIGTLDSQGKTEEALRLLDEVEFSSKDSHSIQATLFLLHRSGMLLKYDRLEDGIDSALQAERLARAQSWSFAQWVSLITVIEGHVAAGDPEKAFRLSEKIAPQLEETSLPARLRARFHGVSSTAAMRLGLYPEALEAQRQVEKIAAAGGSSHERARALTNQALWQLRLGEFDEAESLLVEAKEAYRESRVPGNARWLDVYVAQMLRMQGKQEEAVKVLEELVASVESLDPAQQAELATEVGLCHFRLGDLDKVRTSLETARDRHLETGDAHGLVAAEVNLAALLVHERSMEEAITELTRLEKKLLETGPRARLVGVWEYLGLAYESLGRWELAVEKLELATVESRKMQLKPAFAENAFALGRALQRRGALGESKVWSRSAIETWEKLGREDLVARASYFLGMLLAQLRDFDLAEKAFLDAARDDPSPLRFRARMGNAFLKLELGRIDDAAMKCREILAETELPGIRALALTCLGSCAREQGEFDRAMELLTEAADVLGTRHGGELVLTRIARARTHFARGDRPEGEKELREAMKKLAKRNDPVTLARTRMILAGSRLADDPEESLALAHEAMKAFVGKETGLREEEALGLREMVRECVDLAVEAAVAIPELEKRLPSQKELRHLLRMFDAGRSLLLADRIENGEEGFLTGIRPIDPKAFQSSLPPGEAWVLHHFTRDRSVGLLVRKSGLSLASLPPPAELLEGANRFLTQVSWNDTPELLDAEIEQAAKLYDGLIRPLEPGLEGATELVICPDEWIQGRARELVSSVLSEIPYCALVPRTEPKLERLVQRYAIRLVPSPSTEHAIHEREEAAGPVDLRKMPAVVVGCSPARPEGDDVFRDDRSRLPYAVREARTVASQLADATLLTGDKATRVSLLQTLKSHGKRWNGMLHIATHGNFLPFQPDAWGLVLSRGQVLTPGDLENLPGCWLLVNLSACETGRTRYHSGEGNVGLARACLEGGASRVIASHWKVRDKETFEFMSLFSRKLLQEKLAPHRALQETQVAMIENGVANPYYWSSFSLWGLGALP